MKSQNDNHISTLKTDKELVRRRFEACFGRYDRLAVVQQSICGQLARMLSGAVGADDNVQISRALEIGIGTGFLTRILVARHDDAGNIDVEGEGVSTNVISTKNTKWYLNDLVPAARTYAGEFVQGHDVEWLWGDAEEITFPDELDLIASASTVQWFDDMAAFASRAAAASRPGGWLALSTFGPDNFLEIRATTGEGLNYPTAEEFAQFFRNADYEIIALTEETRTLRFDTPADVLHHIKATGVNSIRQTRWTRQQLSDFSRDYLEQFPASDGGVTLTYHPVLLLARKLREFD